MNIIFKRLLFLILFSFLHSATANTVTSLAQRLDAIQQHLSNGHVNTAWGLAEKTHQQLENLKQVTDSEKLAFLTVFAETAIRTQNLKKARSLLNQARLLTNSEQNPVLLAKLSQRFGLWYALNNKKQKARFWYVKANVYAEQSLDLALQISTQINLASVQETPNLIPAYQLIQQLEDKAVQESFLLALADISIQQQPDLAFQAIQQVLTHKNDSQNTRNQAQALAYLAKIYAQKDRVSDALQIIQQAIVLENAPDLLIKWEFLQAQWLKKQGKTELAKQAYKRAVHHIQTIRQDIPIYYANGQSSFKATLAPVYLGLIELLLDNNQEEPTQIELTEVQALWEKFKSAELNDYFRAICKTTSNSSNLKQGIAGKSGTAVIYPIIFPDSLQILLSIQGQIWHFNVPVSKTQLTKTVNELYENTVQVKEISAHKQLNQWILEPLNSVLAEHQIETLIYIPDGVLRKIPLDMMHDGKQYAIEKYAIITNPGLSMLPSNKTSAENKNIFLAGMSDPGPVLDELVDKNIFSLDGRSVLERSVSLPINETQRQTRIGELAKSLALPGVKKELALLSEILKTPALENEKFVLKNFKQAIAQGQSIIHIASHGYFSGDPEKSFILTYDQLLTMNQLVELFKSEAFVDSPVDLISLSACQTAEGDDRSPLGLSGVVVQAGVRNAIGTLWSVADKQTQQLFAKFYQSYIEQGLTKVAALQDAQLSLLRQEDSQHPFYWAPFILIGEGL